jgi:hypothetical protein
VKKNISIVLFFFVSVTGLFSQEILLSPSELYYDFLALNGYIERPYLNYHTLSDSVWDYKNNRNNIWAEENIEAKRNINEDVTYRIYGPRLFTSYNTKTPYGQNDSTLWQGRGFNLFLNTGARFELYGLELTFLPNFAFSQNKEFDLIPPAYSNGKAATYGDYGNFGPTKLDVPQRFGEDPYHEFSWGDSEIRYTWEAFTIGFGTQQIWLGPARINPILLSNNAPPFPKLDIGIRKRAITLFDVYVGDIETRFFWGRLKESDFFDDDDTNDYNLLTGFVLSYSPSFIEGFTVGVNRLMLSKWDSYDSRGLSALLSPMMSTSSGQDERDQRASLVFDYLFTSVSFEIYFEWALNDYTPNRDWLIRYPFHTQAYTFGTRKGFSFLDNNIRGEVLLEITNLESTRDYEFIPWPTTFYGHHVITQGHTNRGQWLGAGMGTGGNSQYLGVRFFYNKGYCNIFIQRENINNDYLWFLDREKSPTDKHSYQLRFKTLLSVGIDNYIKLNNAIGFYSGVTYSTIFNPTYDHENKPKSNNLHVVAGINLTI